MVLSEKDQELQTLAEGVNLQPRVHFDHTFKTPYPLIDNDPHFLRVVRYFRAQDYLAWAAGAAAFPALFYTIGNSTEILVATSLSDESCTVTKMVHRIGLNYSQLGLDGGF